MLHNIFAVFLIPVQHHLGVGLRGKHMAAQLQIRAQVLEIINLAVAGEDDLSVLAVQRLATARRVDDRKTAKRHSHFIFQEIPLRVRPPVRDGVRHSAQRLRRVVGQTPICETGNAAHTRPSFPAVP